MIDARYLVEAFGLPLDYRSLTSGGRQLARKSAMRQWYDPDPSKAHILCTDTEAFVRAHRLWVEFYLKPDPHNAGIYHFTDPTHKYDMVRMAMSPSLTHNQPSKAACVAPRGSTKTITLIQEMCSMMACVRVTRIQILISEMNADRTAEEIRNLRLQVENNALIQRDFGGPGVLYPKGRTGGERWNDTTLSFQHNKSVIMGFSVSSKQRGRHPTFGIIDDPEDEELSRNPEWRRRYFRWLFKTYMPMFGPGGKVMWIGTLIHEFSCLQLAISGAKEVQEQDEEVETERDERFDDWSRRNWEMISEDPKTGDRTSLFPEKMSVEDFERYKKTYGLSAAMSEFQGICVAEGQMVFDRHPHRHGYMRCVSSDDRGEDYFMDLRTGERMPWEAFLASLYVVGAGDLSDSVAPTADPGALVFIGVSPEGIVYVLDAYIRRCHADNLVKMGYEMSEWWNAQKMGWEKAAMQSAVVRYAMHYGEKLRKEGKTPPVCKGIVNNQVDKVRRIMAALMPLMGDYRIRFLRMETFVDGAGVKHEPRGHGHSRYLRILSEQVDGFTDEGGTGHDDGIDALEMALRLLGRAIGKEVADDGDTPDKSIERWAEVGMVWPRHIIPRECWTEKMQEEGRRPVESGVEAEMDPYE